MKEYEFYNIDKTIHWVFFLVIGLIPLIIRAKIIEFAAPNFISGIANTGLKVDVFNYYKWVFLLILTAVALILFIIKLIKGYRINKNFINIPLLIFAIFILFSGVVAEYKTIAMNGMYNRYEGTLTYLCYLTLFFIAANTRYDYVFFKRLFMALGLVVTANAFLSISHFFGYQSISDAVTKGIVLPSEMANAGNGNIWGTISNQNYLSGFAASCVVFYMYLSAVSKSMQNKIILGLMAVLSFALLISSLSSSGFLTTVIVFPILMFIALYLSTDKVKSIVTIGCITLSCVFTFLLMSNHDEKVSDETIKLFNNVPSIVEQGVNISTLPLISVKYAEASTQNNGANDISEFDLPKPGYSAGTGRTYIWSKTIELIGDRPFLGYGLDTLTYYFPQNDKNKVANLNSYDILVDKPHNLYLGVGFGVGIVGLLALITLVLLNIVNIFKCIISKTCEPVFLPAILVFILAFFIQALFNDSVIGYSPISWLLMGVSVSVGLNKLQPEP